MAKPFSWPRTPTPPPVYSPFKQAVHQKPAVPPRPVPAPFKPVAAPAAPRLPRPAAPPVHAARVAPNGSLHRSRAVGAPVQRKATASPAPRPPVRRASQTVQMVIDFDAWAATDPGSAGTRPQRYFNAVLLPAYKSTFQTIEGRAPKNEDTLKQLQPATRPLYTAFKDAYAKGTYPQAEMNALASALTAADKQIASVTHFRQSAMGSLPPDLLQRIATFLDIGSRVRFSSTGSYLRTNLLGAPAATVWHSTRKMVSFTLQDIIDFMSAYEFGGLHGSTSTHKASMFKEVRLISSADRIYETGQLGDGFYMTEGSSKPAHRVYADSVAAEAVKKHKGSKYLYRIFVENLSGMKTKEVPKSDWADMERNRAPRQLETDTASFDALKAPIVKSETSRQIKINPRAIRFVLALPATGPSGTITQEDFMSWLQELMSGKRL